jgi:ABC-type lipoprotein export system ATPase subunit
MQSRILMIARAILMEPRLIVVDGLLDGLHGDELDTVCKALQASDGWSLIVVTALPSIAKRFNEIYELDKSMISNNLYQSELISQTPAFVRRLGRWLFWLFLLFHF